MRHVCQPAAALDKMDYTVYFKLYYDFCLWDFILEMRIHLWSLEGHLPRIFASLYSVTHPSRSYTVTHPERVLAWIRWPCIPRFASALPFSYSTQ